MQAEIVVYKTLLDPNNTIVFRNKDDRDDYFTRYEHRLVLGECSFNGSRNIKINGYYQELIDSGYNYCSVKTSTTIYYCYIDDYKYVNDNLSELYLTIDYLTTYLPKIGSGSIQTRRNIRRLNGSLYSYIGMPEMMYNNTFPVSSKREVYKYNVSFNKNKIMYILVHFRTRDTVNSISIGGVSDTNLDGFSTLVLPFTALTDGSGRYHISEYKPSLVAGGVTGTLRTFLSSFANDIIQMSLVDYIHLDTLKSNIRVSSVMASDEKYILLIRNLIWYEELRIPYKYISNKLNSTYYNIKFGRTDKYSLLDPNELDYFQTNTSDKCIRIKVQMSAAAPFNYMCNVIGKTSTNTLTIEPLAISLPYMVSEWQQFYANNSASINDGLNTQHKYAIEQAERNLDTEYGKAISQGVTGGIGGVASIIGSLINPVSAIIGVSQLANTANNITQTLVGTENAYINTIKNVELEKELLQISYQNIKSAPDKIVFSQSDFGIIGCKSGIYFIIEEAFNITDINRYHLIYGYEYNDVYSHYRDLMLILNYLDEFTENRKHNYVQFSDVKLTDSYPLSVKNAIINILRNGVHLWSKDATIGDYNE